MTKLALVTITCRPEPRFGDVANALTAGIIGSGGPDLTWIVVDDVLWDESRAPQRRDQLAKAVDGRFALYHYPPKPSKVRGPGRETTEDLPDQNNARNTGLAFAIALGADYVIYLDDCTIPTLSLLQCAMVAAEKNACLRVPIVFKNDIAVARDGRVLHGESGGLHFVPCKATTAAGGCFGMPTEALIDIGGFDEVYAGAMGKQDLDAFVRTERAGWKWITTKRCVAIQLGKTHDKASVSRNDEALSGRPSQKPWNALLRDKTRFMPTVDWKMEKCTQAAREAVQPPQIPIVSSVSSAPAPTVKLPLAPLPIVDDRTPTDEDLNRDRPWDD